MSNSPNAGFNLQVTGSNNGTWGSDLNSNFSIADSLYGGRVTVNCAGSSNITPTTSQAQNFFQVLTGTLTGNILYILPATGGQFFIINNTTGAYTVTVVNNASGAGVAVAQGGAVYVASDPDNTTVYGGIPSSLSLSSLTVSGQITSTQATGTAPFVVASTTPVSNLSIGGNAATATNATTATALATGGTIAITGDLSYTSPAFTGSNVTAAGMLATVNSNVGSFTSANITVNAKGLITAASSGSSGVITPSYLVRNLVLGTSYTPASNVANFYAIVLGSTGSYNSAGSVAQTNGGIGGGGYAEKFYSSPVGPYSYSVGIGHVGTSTGTGGTTTFDSISVTGSSGPTSTVTGGAGGVATGGTFNATGGTGGNGSIGNSSQGGPGAGAGRSGNGGNGGNFAGGANGGGGGTGGNNGSGITAGAAASGVSGSALTLPIKLEYEIFSAGTNGGNSITANAAYGSPAIDLTSPFPILGAPAGGSVNYGAINAVGGFNGAVYILEILK